MLSAQRNSARQIIRTLDAKISDLQSSLDSLSVDEADIAILKASMQETLAALQTAEEEYTQTAWDTKMSSVEFKISTVDEELRQIHKELTSTSVQSEFRAKVDVLKGDLAKKTQAQNALIVSYAERFKKLVGVELTANTVDSQINVLLRRKAEDLEDAERLLESAAKEISQYEAKITTAKEQLRDKRKEKNEVYAKVMEVCEEEINDFPEVVKRCEADVTEIKM
jgi:DNA repair protein RAD50